MALLPASRPGGAAGANRSREQSCPPCPSHGSPGGEPACVAALPRSFHRPWTKVLAHIGHRIASGYAVEDGQASQCRARSSMTTCTCDLHPFRCGALPGFTKRTDGIVEVQGQAKVRPSHPSGVPHHGQGRTAEQVKTEIGHEPESQWPAQSSAPDQSARWQTDHSGVIHVPSAHGRHVPDIRCS